MFLIPGDWALGPSLMSKHGPRRGQKRDRATLKRSLTNYYQSSSVSHYQKPQTDMLIKRQLAIEGTLVLLAIPVNFEALSS